MPNKLTHHITEPQLNHILEKLEEKCDTRLQIICLLVPKGLRIQDVLDLSIDDIYDDDGSPYKKAYVKEKKTKKRKIVSLAGEKLQKALRSHWELVKKLPSSAPLFYNNRGEKLSQHGVRYILHKMFDGKEGIRRKFFATHSFRKFGARKMFLDGGRNIVIVSKILNHCNTDVTYTYIDVQPQEIRRVTSVVDL